MASDGASCTYAGRHRSHFSPPLPAPRDLVPENFPVPDRFDVAAGGAACMSLAKITPGVFELSSLPGHLPPRGTTATGWAFLCPTAPVDGRPQLQPQHVPVRRHASAGLLADLQPGPGQTGRWRRSSWQRRHQPLGLPLRGCTCTRRRRAADVISAGDAQASWHTEPGDGGRLPAALLGLLFTGAARAAPRSCNCTRGCENTIQCLGQPAPRTRPVGRPCNVR
jgi:hypothetical protein